MCVYDDDDSSTARQGYCYCNHGLTKPIHRSTHASPTNLWNILLSL